MNQLFDFIPILVFVGVFFATDIYIATAALIAAVTLQVGLYWATKRTISTELKITFWAVVIFGSLTLWFRNELFVQWKPTVVNWALAAILLGSRALGKGDLLKKMLGKQLTLPDLVWGRLNVGWAAGFILAGALNLLVAYNFSMETWVSYKLIGGFALTFCYMIITMVYLSRGGFLDEIAEAEPVESPAATKEHRDSNVEQSG